MFILLPDKIFYYNFIPKFKVIKELLFNQAPATSKITAVKECKSEQEDSQPEHDSSSSKSNEDSQLGHDSSSSKKNHSTNNEESESGILYIFEHTLLVI